VHTIYTADSVCILIARLSVYRKHRWQVIGQSIIHEMAVADSLERADSDNYPEIFWFIVCSSSTALNAAIFLSVAMSLHALMLINYLSCCCCWS